MTREKKMYVVIIEDEGFYLLNNNDEVIQHTGYSDELLFSRLKELDIIAVFNCPVSDYLDSEFSGSMLWQRTEEKKQVLEKESLEDFEFTIQKLIDYYNSQVPPEEAIRIVKIGLSNPFEQVETIFKTSIYPELVLKQDEDWGIQNIDGNALANLNSEDLYHFLLNA